MSKKSKKGFEKPIYLVLLNYDIVKNDPYFEDSGEWVYDDDTKIFHINNSEYFIYGITQNKKLVEKFFIYRNKDKYAVKKIKLNKEEYEDFVGRYHLAILKEVSFDYGKSFIDLVVTENEYEVYISSSDWLDNVLDDLLPYEFPMKLFLNICNRKVYKILKDSSVITMAESLHSIKIGEPLSLMPNIITLLMDEFRYSF